MLLLYLIVTTLKTLEHGKWCVYIVIQLEACMLLLLLVVNYLLVIRVHSNWRLAVLNFQFIAFVAYN